MTYRDLWRFSLFWAFVYLANGASIEEDGINFGPRAKRPVGRPYQDWSLECIRRRAIGGFKSRVYSSSGKGNDVMIRSFCRSIAHRKDPILRVSGKDCRETKSFSLKEDTVLIGDQSRNCLENEFIRAIRSDYNDGNRMVNLLCCKPLNAEIDQFVGCNTEGPVNLFETYHGFIKDPYEPRAGCPRDALVSIVVENGGLSFKYCPFRIDGRNYLTTCPEKKSKLLLKKREIDSGAVESLYRLREKQWSGVHQSWSFECKGTKVIDTVRVGFAFHPDKVRRDVLWQFECGKQTRQAQVAKNVRITKWTAINWEHASLDSYGCRGNEALIGVASTFDEKTEKRSMALICGEMCNADIDPSSTRDDEIVLEWGEVKDVKGNKPEIIRNLGLGVKGEEKASLLTVFSTYDFVDAKCDSSTRTDENTGETIDPWPLELDIDSPPSGLPKVSAGKWTKLRKSWRTQCSDYEVVQKFSVKSVSDDVSMTISCTKLVEGKQKARIVRYTKWMQMRSMQVNRGCRDSEALQGIISHFSEDRQRAISLICVDVSNAEQSGSKEEKSSDISLKKAKYSVTGNVLSNIYSETDDDVLSMTGVFTKYKYKSTPRFRDSELVNEIEGVSSPIVDVNVDDMSSVESGKWTDDGSDFKFMCDGEFEAISSVQARGRILRDGSDDHEFKFECKKVLAELNMATRTRWTPWMEVHNMKIKLGCNDQEIMHGWAGHWDKTRKTRFITFSCVEGSNAELSEGPRVVSQEVKEGQHGTVMVGEEEIFQNLLASGFLSELARTEFTSYFVKFKHRSAAKFTETSKITGSGDTEKLVNINPADLPVIVENKWSPSGAKFSFECKPQSAISETLIRVVPWFGEPGEYDVVYKLKCKQVLAAKSQAYTLRYTKYQYIRELSSDKGCMDDEVLAGMSSTIVDGDRYMSLTCLKLSNMKAVQKNIGPNQYKLSRVPAKIMVQQLLPIQNTYTSVNQKNELVFFYTFAKYEYNDNAAFTKCQSINDVSGTIDIIQGCGNPSGFSSGDVAGKPAWTLKPVDVLAGDKGQGYCALDGVCPSWWNYNRDCPKLSGCFRVFQIGKLSWEAASTICKERYKGRLAQFETHAKWEHMKEHLLLDGKRFWMGIKRPKGINGFPQWFDGTSINVESWMPKGTNNEGATEVCGLVRNKEWYDDVCYSSWNEGFICEIP